MLMDVVVSKTKAFYVSRLRTEINVGWIAMKTENPQ